MLILDHGMVMAKSKDILMLQEVKHVKLGKYHNY